ncbi:hypothetical protein E0Z10_g6880 [Xylaria hypoxylon]|uniref:RING-type domain-containing protein n=1 Tax=Xylaria hypoxylon TaxID=37992 RepID=A0A4Z0YCF2_9PEZI|nr:hypothetical protein E0Z10_g6880 [Xylaria hypoxylon]
MATNPYEVEHNVEPSTDRPPRRRVDMSSFESYRNQITSDPSSRIGPTPVDMAGLFQLVQDQIATLASDAPTDANRDFLASLMATLEEDAANPPDRIQGVSQEYLDTLERVSLKRLRSDPECECMICAEKFLDDPHPLVVELPCNSKHIFDLECVGPWLTSKGTCPLCRKNLAEKKTIDIPKDEEEDDDEDIDGLYG